MKLFFLSLMALSLLSCGTDNQRDYTVTTYSGATQRTSEVVELSGESYGPISKYGYLRDIYLVNNLLVVLDEKSDQVFSAYDKSGVLEIQPTGDGPGKVKHPELLKIVGIHDATEELCVFDYVGKSLNSIKMKDGEVLKEVAKIPSSYWGGVQSAVAINDSLIAITGSFSDTKFVVINVNTGEEVLRSENVITFTDELSVEGKALVAPTDINYNEGNDLLVLKNSSLNSVDTYTSDGRFYKSYSFGEFQNISKENELKQDYFYYYGVKTDNDIAYGLFLGKKRNEIALKNLFLLNARPELHVYNLKTDALTRYVMDRLVSACVVDTDAKYIYCIEEENEDQPIVRYEIL